MDAATYASLTERQRECLRLVARDRDSKEIGRLLGGKSPETVNTHLKAAMQKLGHSSRFTAARELREFETSHPRLVNQPSAMEADAPPNDLRQIEYGARSASPQILRDGYVVPENGPTDLASSFDGRRASDGESRLGRLTLAAALTVLIALAVIAAVPMSDAFERFAEVLRPHLRR